MKINGSLSRHQIMPRLSEQAESAETSSADFGDRFISELRDVGNQLALPLAAGAGWVVGRVEGFARDLKSEFINPDRSQLANLGWGVATAVLIATVGVVTMPLSFALGAFRSVEYSEPGEAFDDSRHRSRLPV